MPKSQPMYALYHGDEFIDLGTPKELSKRNNIKKETIFYYNSPSYKKNKFKGNRYIVIKIE